jgi:hypothetical protein
MYFIEYSPAPVTTGSVSAVYREQKKEKLKK